MKHKPKPRRSTQNTAHRSGIRLIKLAVDVGLAGLLLVHPESRVAQICVVLALLVPSFVDAVRTLA